MKIYDQINLDEMKGRVYVMSDLHINHMNVIKYGRRPFENVEEMNRSILDELHRVLQPEDYLFDLGDMFWEMKAPEIDDILKTINVKRFYKVVGNHDKTTFYMGPQAVLAKRFTLVADIIDCRVRFGGERLFVSFCHYPLLEWNHKSRGGLCIQGHSHGALDAFNADSHDLRLEIGYDSTIAKELGTFLIPLDEIIRKFKEKVGDKTFYDWANMEF